MFEQKLNLTFDGSLDYSHVGNNVMMVKIVANIRHQHRYRRPFGDPARILWSICLLSHFVENQIFSKTRFILFFCLRLNFLIHFRYKL